MKIIDDVIKKYKNYLTVLASPESRDFCKDVIEDIKNIKYELENSHPLIVGYTHNDKISVTVNDSNVITATIQDGIMVTEINMLDGGSWIIY